MSIITYLPSSSLRSYSSVKRVVVTSEFDIGILFVTAAILIIGIVVGDAAFVLLSFLVVLLLLSLLVVL
jgi:hypothetical protein